MLIIPSFGSFIDGELYNKDLEGNLFGIYSSKNRIDFVSYYDEAIIRDLLFHEDYTSIKLKLCRN